MLSTMMPMASMLVSASTRLAIANLRASMARDSSMRSATLIDRIWNACPMMGLAPMMCPFCTSDLRGRMADDEDSRFTIEVVGVTGLKACKPEMLSFAVVLEARIAADAAALTVLMLNRFAEMKGRVWKRM